MTELTDALQYYTGVMILTVLFMVAALVAIAMSRTINWRTRRVFMIAAVSIIVVLLTDWFSVLVDGRYPDLHVAHAVSTAVTFSLAPAIPAVLAAVLFSNVNTTWVRVILAAHTALEIASIFGGFVFWVDETNLYHRGQLYNAYIFVYTVSCVYLIVMSIRAGNAFQSSNIVALIAIIVCMISGIVLQLLFSAAHTSWTAIALGVTLYYVYYCDITLRNDALTKLMSRRSYEEALANPPLPCTVVLLDVDDFKTVNDTYGHAFGDTCLVMIADCIKRAFAQSGKCFRTGGDEFVVLMTKNQGDVKALTDVFESDLARLRASDERMPSVSVGYAAADAHCTDLTAVIDAADSTMYGSKRADRAARPEPAQNDDFSADTPDSHDGRQRTEPHA